MEAPTIGNYISRVDQRVDFYVSEVLMEEGCSEYLVRIKLGDEINCLNKADWLLAMGCLKLEKRM